MKVEARGAAASKTAQVAMAPSVFVVDDDASIREALELLILTAGWQPRTFASAEEFLDWPRTLTPGCLILDITLPRLDGFELQRLIADHAETPIIFITGHGDARMAIRAIKAGAVDFLEKPFRAEAMLGAIRAALEYSQAVVRQELSMEPIRKRFVSLTCREREVMSLITAGLVNWRIGAQLGIRECTIKAHRREIMRKMNARSLADLVVMSLRLSSTPVLTGRLS
jgi:FixJ family two-component response regulator